MNAQSLAVLVLLLGDPDKAGWQGALDDLRMVG